MQPPEHHWRSYHLTPQSSHDFPHQPAGKPVKKNGPTACRPCTTSSQILSSRTSSPPLDSLLKLRDTLLSLRVFAVPSLFPGCPQLSTPRPPFQRVPLSILNDTAYTRISHYHTPSPPLLLHCSPLHSSPSDIQNSVVHFSLSPSMPNHHSPHPPTSRTWVSKLSLRR